MRISDWSSDVCSSDLLRLLPSYLQQLEMESNGKSVTKAGKPVDGPTASITWGGVGTDAQHAVFQLLHQGTHVVPVEFIASIEPGDSLDRSEEHTSELQSLMSISYAVFCLRKKQHA